MNNVAIVDSAGDGAIHLVTIAGRCAAYLRSTDDGAGPKPAPGWLQIAAKVVSWADGRGGKAAEFTRAHIKSLGLAYEARPVDRHTHGLAVYPPDNTARRVTLAALAGARNTTYD